MFKISKPDKYYHSILDINYELLVKENIKYLLFDLDNTIITYDEKIPSKEIIDLFGEIKALGLIPIIITNALPKRANRVGNLLNIDTYYLSYKPRRRNYDKIIAKYNMDVANAIAIGDQIYTDVKGAQKLGIKTIFVDQLGKRDSFYSIINRLKEKRLIKKEHIIEKGKYYE